MNCLTIIHFYSTYKWVNLEKFKNTLKKILYILLKKEMTQRFYNPEKAETF